MPTEVWTVLALLNWATEYLGTHQVEQPRATAEILLAHGLGLGRIDLYVNYDRPLDSGELAVFKAFIKRRLRHEPVAYIVGEKGFWTLDLRVTRDVLIPRPETEFLVETALSILPRHQQTVPWKVLDLGTGSGAIVLALSHECPFHHYFAGDISFDAIQVARENAKRYTLEKKVGFFCGYWLEAVSKRCGKFSMIVSNPPYVRRGDIPSLPRDVSFFEPTLALDGGPDGLDYIRRIIESATRFLDPGGWLLLEIGDDHWENVKQMIEENGGYSEVEAVKDYSAVNRVVRAKSVSI